MGSSGLQALQACGMGFRSVPGLQHSQGPACSQLSQSLLREVQTGANTPKKCDTMRRHARTNDDKDENGVKGELPHATKSTKIFGDT